MSEWIISSTPVINMLSNMATLVSWLAAGLLIWRKINSVYHLVNSQTAHLIDIEKKLSKEQGIKEGIKEGVAQQKAETAEAPLAERFRTKA